MGTARQIITKAMQKAGVLTKSEAPDADEANDALDALNDMLSSWSTDSLVTYSRVWESFTLTGNKGDYTIGTGGDFNTDKPVEIVEAHIKNGTTDYSMDVVSDVVYNRYIITKTTQGIPYWLNFDNAFPLSTIRLFPVPSTAYDLFILSEKQLTQLAIDDTVSLPAGWNRALIYSLALELSPDYGQAATRDIVAIAKSSKAAIRRAVAKSKDMNAQPLGLNTRNVYTGYNRG